MASDVTVGPVAEFCADLKHLRLTSGLNVVTLTRQLNISRAQLYAILNGEIKRPPDWHRFVRPLVAACTDSDVKALAQWRQRHTVLVGVCEELRRRDRLASITGSSAPSQATPEISAAFSVDANAAHASSPDIGSSHERSPTQLQILPSWTTRPRQLPAAFPYFSGRLAELEALDDLMRRPPMGMAVISAIGGTAGVGKTALAVHWGRRVSRRFPDGQLYLDLRGFSPDGHVMTPGEAIRILLDGLGVLPEHIPVSLEAQVGLYRSLLAGRQMLIVLDNARDSGQVRLLVPGEPGCLVIVTSRNQLTSLVAAEGAHPIDLDVLTHAESLNLLASRLGQDRLTTEPEAAEEIVFQCACLPLALAIVAARAASYPYFTLSALAAELRNSRDRLEAFAGEQPASDLRAIFSWSYRVLTENTARLFRLLSIHPGPDISAPAAASLAGQPLSETRSALAELTRAHLITEHAPGRYRFHDLLRVYATEQATDVDPHIQQQDATRRMLDHYLHTGHVGAVILNPHRDPIALTPCLPDVAPERLDDHQQALAWFTAEQAVLLAVIHRSLAEGFEEHTWQLAWTLPTFLDRRGYWQDQLTTQRAALTAAQRLANPKVQAMAYRLLAHASTRLGHLDDARTSLQHALTLATKADDPVGQAHAHYNLARMQGRSERIPEALQHALRALELYEAAGHQDGLANALNTASWYNSQLGNHEQALPYCQRALTLHQKLHDRYGQGHTWDTLGYIHHALGHYAQAIHCYQEALGLFRELRDRYDEGEILHHLGDTYRAIGNTAAARSAWRKALKIFNDLHHHDAELTEAKLNPRRPT